MTKSVALSLSLVRPRHGAARFIAMWKFLLSALYVKKKHVASVVSDYLKEKIYFLRGPYVIKQIAHRMRCANKLPMYGSVWCVAQMFVKFQECLKSFVQRDCLRNALCCVCACCASLCNIFQLEADFLREMSGACLISVVIMTTIGNKEFWRELFAIYREFPEIWKIKSDIYNNRNFHTIFCAGLPIYCYVFCKIFWWCPSI